MSSADPSHHRFDRRIAEMGHIRRAENLMIEGENEQALERLERAASLREAAGTLDLIGRCQHRLGRINAAIAAFERIVATPARAGRHLFGAERGLIYALRDAGRHADADEAARRLAARYADDPLAVSRAILETDGRLPYHRWCDFAEKDRLSYTLSRWHARYSDREMFWPESFVLPAEQASFDRFRTGCADDQIFIVKPPSHSGGKGIVVTRNPPRADRPTVVQRYLDRPYLIDGRKFHVRLHVLVTTHAGAQAFLQHEGIVRIAAEPYRTDARALTQTAGHITNTALHRYHRDMQIAASDGDALGNVWSLSALLRRLAEDGRDADEIRSGMVEVARSLVGIVAESGLFVSQAAEHSRYCFPPLLVGLDLLLDQAGKSWLLECQRSPSLIGNALVDRIVGALGASAFPLQVQALDDEASRERIAIPDGFERLL